MQLNFVLVGKTRSDQFEGLDLQQFYFNICLDFDFPGCPVEHVAIIILFVRQWFENVPGYIEDLSSTFLMYFLPVL